MASLHMLGHMVAMAIIATLLKQIMELNAEVSKLREQLEHKKETKKCLRDNGNEEQEMKPTAPQTTAAEKTSGDDEEDNSVVRESETNSSFSSVLSKTSKQLEPVPFIARESNSVEDGDNVSQKSDVTNSSEWMKPAEHIPLVSSVWCHEGINQLCQFENLCYNSVAGDFVLFQHETSMLENIQIEDGSLNVDLSTVKDHNTQQTSVVSLPSNTFQKFQVLWVNDTTLVFRPFLPDNLMHMFHDDIIPLHHTLKLISLWKSTPNKNGFHEPYDIQLFLLENSSFMSDEVEQFYAAFSKFKIKWKDTYKFGSGLTCFKSAFIGLSKSTVWYDYGFTKPQGPIESHNSNGKIVRSTADFIRQNLPASGLNMHSQGYVVLLSRRENRKILNEVELTLDLIKSTELKVVILNYESYSLLELIWYVNHSRGIIAMHGSLLMLSMFLSPGSFVIELFPYAVNPSNYTPYKTLAELDGMGLVYKAWTNRISANSFGHPDWPEEVGGLNHIEEHDREAILAQTEVPPHLCCSDPSWLYHIYQDTVVEAGEICTLVKQALKDSSAVDSYTTHNVFHPSGVQNISCKFKSVSGKVKSGDTEKQVLKLQWDIPWTVSYLDIQKVHYELLLQSYGRHTDPVTLQSEKTSLTVDNVTMDDYNVWIRCVINKNVASPYRIGVCHKEYK